jgi:hypothetical protein
MMQPAQPQTRIMVPHGQAHWECIETAIIVSSYEE